MYLIVGLGNPGSEYSSTKHNIGRIAMDLLIEQLSIQPKWIYDKNAKANILISDTSSFDLEGIEEDKIIRAKPQTYMNLSGMSVSGLAKYYKIPNKNILVLHDDLDLEVGKIKYKPKGSSGGQNGIKDIINKLGTQEFYRIKIGIGRPANPAYDIVRYVLSKNTNEELLLLKEQLPIIIRSIELFLQGKC